MFSPTTLALAAVAALVATPSFVHAKIECDTSLGTFYPYCINIPDGASSSGQNYPTIVFLSGSGARGPPSKVRELSGYDGDGKLVNQYYSGNKGAAQTMAATRFVVVTPILPKYADGQEQRHYFPEHLDKLYAHLKNKGYPIDWDRLHLGGYSMGGRGTCRNGVARPELYASLSPTAGACEAPGTGTLSQQKASSTLDKVTAIKNIPLRQYAGKWDNTVGQSSPKQMQDALEKVGATNAKLIWVDGSHNDMSTKPFTVDRLEWMLKQRRGGGTVENNDNNDNKQNEEKPKKEVLNPDETGKGNNASEGRFIVDLGNGGNQESAPSSPSNESPSSDASPAPSALASPSPSKGGVCKRRRRSKRNAKRSMGASTTSSKQNLKRGLTLAAIVASAEKKVDDLQKRTPLESLKAHAGNRRSIHGSKLGSKVSR